MIQHFGQESGRISTSREPEEVNVVARGVVSHQELRLLMAHSRPDATELIARHRNVDSGGGAYPVTSHYVQIEGCAY
jgi:hypothetical protein